MNASAHSRVRMEPAGLYRRHPLAPHQLTQDLTPVEDCIVLAHLGVPRIEEHDWTVRVSGLVRDSLALSLADLRAMPRTDVLTVHECAGSPLEPTVPTRRVVNVRWSGVLLREVLDRAGVDPAAEYLWSFGADGGAFGQVHVDAYAKDLPLWRLAESDVLLAYEINGQPLPAENGFPVRLVVPGWYGTNSVKWLRELRLADRRLDGLFTTQLYLDEVPGTQQRRPVWRIAPECVLVSPAPESTVTGPVDVWGRAWGDAEIVQVQVSADGGSTWSPALLEPREQRAWQRFNFGWTPTRPGKATLLARATDRDGETQPISGARNAVHAVDVVVGSA